MAVDRSFLEHVMELLAPLKDIRSQAMFGGYGIFYEGDMFALILGGTLCFKVDDLNLPAYEEAGGKRFTPIPYYEVRPKCWRTPLCCAIGRSLQWK